MGFRFFNDNKKARGIFSRGTYRYSSGVPTVILSEYRPCGCYPPFFALVCVLRPESIRGGAPEIISRILLPIQEPFHV